MKPDWTCLDSQLRRFSSFFRDEFNITPPQSNSIATTIAQEIRVLDAMSLKAVCNVDSVGLRNRLDELIAFQAWMDIVHSLPPHPSIIRAQVITQNYICLVYLGESVFKALRSQMPNGSVTKKCCKFLTDNPIRAFRNAIAHANWKYKDDFKGITYWARKGDQKDESMTQWEVSQSNLDFWQALARCTGYVAYTELLERGK